MSTALVTGGCGFIGDHLVRLLRERGEEVRVLDQAPPETPRAGVEYVRADITDVPAVRNAVEGVDTVYHLAAKAGLWDPDPTIFERVNATGSRAVFQAAEEAGVERAVHCSTEAVLKSRRRRSSTEPIDEEVWLEPHELAGAYARGKWAAEREALAAAERGLHVVVVNPTVPVGPDDRNLTPPSRMLLGYLNGDYPAYVRSFYNMVDVRDVAEGHVRAAERGRSGERYLLAAHDLSMREILDLLEELTGLPMPRWRVPYPVAWITAVSSQLRARITGNPPTAPLTGLRIARDPDRFTNRKARSELGMDFRPLRASLEDQVRWFRDRGLLERPLPSLD